MALSTSDYDMLQEYLSRIAIALEALVKLKQQEMDRG